MLSPCCDVRGYVVLMGDGGPIVWETPAICSKCNKLFDYKPIITPELIRASLDYDWMQKSPTSDVEIHVAYLDMLTVQAFRYIINAWEDGRCDKPLECCKVVLKQDWATNVS